MEDLINQMGTALAYFTHGVGMTLRSIVFDIVHSMGAGAFVFTGLSIAMVVTILSSIKGAVEDGRRSRLGSRTND